MDSNKIYLAKIFDSYETIDAYGLIRSTEYESNSWEMSSLHFYTKGNSFPKYKRAALRFSDYIDYILQNGKEVYEFADWQELAEFISKVPKS